MEESVLDPKGRKRSAEPDRIRAMGEKHWSRKTSDLVQEKEVKGLSWGCSTEMKEAMRDPTSRISDQ
jgi:hypothetical protein